MTVGHARVGAVSGDFWKFLEAGRAFDTLSPC